MDTPKDGTANDADALDRKLWGEDGPYPPDDGELFDYRGKTRGEEDRDSTQMVAYYVVLPLLVGIILGLGLMIKTILRWL